MAAPIVFTCPAWCDIPSIDLYLDQVLILVDSIVSPMIPVKDKIITATMVNNYVKHKIISPTEKKKYSRKQITEIIMVTLLKLVLSSAEISMVLSELGSVFQTPENIYSAFAIMLSHKLGICSLPQYKSFPELASAALEALSGKMRFYQIFSQF